MGKGDKRTKRGKIVLGSHGKSRPKKVKAAAPKATTDAPAEA
ncbi:MAG: 30S ribosomal protein THX [Saprospiraceae bacterium]|nr:30S ribosomal protein THX [Saprospiraceae bacterium]